jgi:hypothetical protein
MQCPEFIELCDNFTMVFSTVGQLRISTTSLVTTFLVFPLTFNFRILNPLNYGWLWSGGDISSSFAGWNYFRHAPLFQWPISDNPLYGENIAQSIIFTDTPPIFAIPFKFIGFFTTEIFQFTGFQIATSFFLLIYFSQKILNLYKLDAGSRIVGSILISQAPFYLFRNQFEHYSLNLMWVAIAALFLYLKEKSVMPVTRSDLKWWSLIFIALIWMPYLTIYVVIFLVPIIIEKFINQPTQALKNRYLLQQLRNFLIVLITGLTINGYWENAGKSGAEGFGYYNANLLSFINSNSGSGQSWSQIFQGFPSSSEGQYEGFAYLGSGTFFLIVLNILLKNHSTKKLFFENIKKHRFLAFSIFFTFLWATAGNFTLGNKTLLVLVFPSEVLKFISIFRSSGRFLIPVAFLLMFFIIIVTFKNFRKKVSLVLILAALILTTYDQLPNTKIIRDKQSKSNSLTFDQDKIRNLLVRENITNIIFVEPEMSAYIWKMNIIGQASLLGIPVNDGFIARINQSRLDENILASRKAILMDELLPNRLYVLYPDFIKKHKDEIRDLKVNHKFIEFQESLLVVR